MRAVEHVSSLLVDLPNAFVTLFHAIPLHPPPGQIWEASPELAGRVAADDGAQHRSLALSRARHETMQLMEKLQTTLCARGLDRDSIEQVVIPVSGMKEVVARILAEADERACGTVITGRDAYGWLRELAHHHVADHLLAEAHELGVFVVT